MKEVLYRLEQKAQSIRCRGGKLPKFAVGFENMSVRKFSEMIIGGEIIELCQSMIDFEYALAEVRRYFEKRQIKVDKKDKDSLNYWINLNRAKTYKIPSIEPPLSEDFIRNELKKEIRA